MTTSSSDPIWNGDIFPNSLYIAINIENILYGMEALLYLKTINILLSRRKSRRKSDIFYGIFSSVVMSSATVWVIARAAFGQQMWLVNPDFPGGFDAYWQTHATLWYTDWARTSMIVLQLMTDGLMIYRCWIIWDSYCIIVIPVILWLGTLVLGILLDWSSNVPGGDVFIGLAAKLGLAYWTVSMVLNATLTCIISYRLVQYGKWAQEDLGREHASLYFTVTAIVVESTLLSTISGIAFLVSCGMGSGTLVAFGSVYAMMMCISPQMLILRVIAGRAWDNDATKAASTIQFGLGATSRLPEVQESDSITSTRVHESSNLTVLPDGHDKM